MRHSNQLSVHGTQAAALAFVAYTREHFVDPGDTLEECVRLRLEVLSGDDTLVEVTFTERLLVEEVILVPGVLLLKPLRAGASFVSREGPHFRVCYVTLDPRTSDFVSIESLGSILCALADAGADGMRVRFSAASLRDELLAV